MLNGPFRDNLEVVFDTAALFNPPSEWIHKDSLLLKRLVVQKINILSSRTERKFKIK